MTLRRLAPLLLCACIGQALADTPIDLHHAAMPTARISIDNVKGKVTIVGWDRNEIQVSGTLGDGAKPLAITGDNAALAVKVEPQGKSSWFSWGSDNAMAPSVLELHVPKAASLNVHVVSAPLVIDGLDGGRITVGSVSGRARINARTQALTVNSVSGNIELAGHAERTDLQTVSGDILAPVLGGMVDLQTVSGHIQASGGPWQKLTLSTVSGDAQLNGSLSANGTLAIDSMSGDVQLQLPAATSALVHVNSFSGELRSDFGTAEASSDHGPGSKLDLRLGSGNGKINVETFSGDVRIRRQD